jgi:hypothetical protein
VCVCGCVFDANGKDSAMRRNLRFRKTRKEGNHDVEEDGGEMDVEEEVVMDVEEELNVEQGEGQRSTLLPVW